MNLSPQRVAALLEMAGRGSFDFKTFWSDTWNVDIDESDAEIRRQVKEADSGVSLDEALEAAKLLRAADAARAVIRRRYLT